MIWMRAVPAPRFPLQGRADIFAVSTAGRWSLRDHTKYAGSVGGEIERDASGEPTGVLKETARDLVASVYPKGDLRGKSAELGGSWQSVEISGNSGCM